MGIKDFFLPRQLPRKEEFLISSSVNGDRHLQYLAEAIMKSKGKKQTESVPLDKKRVDPKRLEMLYTMDEVIFRCTNIYSMQSVGPWFQLLGEKKAVERIKKFNTDRNLREKLKTVVRDMCIDGNAYWEKIRNTKGQIVDVQRISPSRMDYKRTPFYSVEEDEHGHPVGYVFTSMTGTKIDINPEDIIHFKLNPIGNERAIGFVEPVFRLVFLKLNIRHGYAQAGFRAGNPLYIVYVGDKPDRSNDYAGHKITSDMINKIENEWQNIETKHFFTMPHYTRVESVSSTDARAQSTILEYTDRNIASAFGIPVDIAFGGGKSARATLDVAVERDFDRNINEMQRNVANVLERELYPELLSGISSAVPKIRWNLITPSDLNRKAKRFTSYVEQGILNIDDIRDAVLREEGLESDLPKEMQSEKSKEILQDSMNRMSLQETIIFLANLKDAFPGQLIEKTIDDLIKQISLKTTGIEVPTSSDGMEKEDENAGSDTRQGRDSVESGEAGIPDSQ